MGKDIRLNKGFKDDALEIVMVFFDEPQETCCFTIQELLKILGLWIIGEEKKYPQEKGYMGRWLLYREIKRVFDETPSPYKE